MNTNSPVRYIVFGAGAIGASVGALLHERGHEVVLIARGAHGRSMQRDGLILRRPSGTERRRIPVVTRPSELRFREGDVVLLSVKSPDTAGAVRDLADAAGPLVPVVCLQNGVNNEARVAATFEEAHGAMVYVPATHLIPGEVSLWGAPGPGVIDVGRYPTGLGRVVEDLTRHLSEAGFDSLPQPNIMAWKHAKLLINLGAAVSVLEMPKAHEMTHQVRLEAECCFAAAGVDALSFETLVDGRCAEVGLALIDGEARPGGSLWQSVRRGSELEIDDINGAIVRLGQEYKVATPVNAELVRLMKARQP